MPDKNFVEDCVYCDEPIYGDLASGVIYTIYTENGPRHGHYQCGLREVVGGIGHLVAHDYWCVQKNDPDAGLTRRESSLLVAEWVRFKGVGT